MLSWEKKLEIAATKWVKTKLHELQISKFQGTHLDWVRFWGLFKAQIDKALMNDEAMFAYLKELVVPKVRVTIDKLPLNSEWYGKAKKMLEQRYGDPSEVVNAHIQEIISSPTRNGVSKQKIHNFYDTLLGHVQALEAFGTLGTLPEMWGWLWISWKAFRLTWQEPYRVGRSRLFLI